MSNYHARGEAGPKIALLDASGLTILDTFTLTNVAASSFFGWEYVAPEVRENWEPLYKEIELANGNLQFVVGGYRYVAEYDFPMLDKTYAGYVTAILNHCAQGDRYCQVWPHSDNTYESYKCFIDGEVSDFRDKDRLLNYGHSGRLFIRAIVPVAVMPWPYTRSIKFMDKTAWGAYGAAEKANTQQGDKTAWAAYTANDKSTALGYMTNKGTGNIE